MADYVVCQIKRNNPRMDVRICERKCPEKEHCKAYMNYGKIVLQNAPHSSDPRSLELGAV